MLSSHIKRQMTQGLQAPLDELGIARAYMDLISRMLANPPQIALAQMNLVRDCVALWQQSMLGLMGKQPFPFDLLFWNSDSTRMPYKMHSFYLRNMYMGNLLRVPGGITLAGVPIDLAQVKVPSYFISTAEDHIAPWKGTYLGATALGGPVRFVLGGSGRATLQASSTRLRPTSMATGPTPPRRCPPTPIPGWPRRCSTRAAGGPTGRPG